MAIGSDNKFPKVVLEEVATDGSATVTPAADHRALFLGEDGALHLKDSAAAVTDVAGGVDDILDLPTAEMDDTLVLAPDGAGGVEFRPETGMSAFVGCRAYNNTTQTVTAATETTVLFNAEEYDTDTIHDIVTNTGRFTVPTGKDGKWRFNFHFHTAGSHGNTYAHLRKNGATVITGSEIDNTGGGADFFISVTIDLVATDYIEARGYRTTGTTFGATTGTPSCSMEAQFMG